MDTKTKKSLLIITIILLIVINVSALATIYYNSKIKTKKLTEMNNLKEEVQIKGMHRFIRDELKLSDEQFQQFKEIARTNMIIAHGIALELNEKRTEMMNEIAKENPNSKILDDIASDVGSLHYELKKTTISHFLELKEICNEDQQESLQKIFMQMIRDQDRNKFGRSPREGERGRNRDGRPRRNN